MQSDVQLVQPPPLRVFQYSLDWRFLLPISDPAKIYVAFEEDTDFCEALDQAGIPAPNRFSSASFRQEEGNNICSFVLPFGVPIRWVSARPEEQVDFYRSIRQLLCPGAYFLLGFGNAWSSWSVRQAHYHVSTPSRVTDQLSLAGFRSIKMFGAMPDLRIPEYIFELNAQAAHFALYHRFRRKPLLRNGLQILVQTVGLAHISNFLPCYFVVAVA